MTLQRLMFVQFGDFHEASARLRAGGAENYYGQKESVDFVEALAESYDITVVYPGQAAFDGQTEGGVRCIGVPKARFFTSEAVPEVIAATDPDLAIVRTPHITALQALSDRGTPTLPDFADMMQSPRYFDPAARFGLGTLRNNLRLARALRTLRRPCVANHNLLATESLVRVLGVPRNECLPWELRPLSPEPAVKALREVGPIEVFFAGNYLKSKGITDLVVAVAQMRAAGHDVRLTAYGRGEAENKVKATISELQLRDHVKLGFVSNDTVRQAMRGATIAVVPSRWSYPEAFPSVILEALSTRTPLVVSDHPAFADRFERGRTAMIARQADPADLATQMIALITDPDRYARMSELTAETLEGLYVGVPWSELWQMFLQDPLNDTGWVARHALSALRSGQREVGSGAH